jgi:putative membrane protein
MKQHFAIAAALLAGCLFAAGPAAAQTHANRSTADRTFMMKAAQGGMAEVELGTLAKNNGSSPDVKEFGSKMVDDHTAANNELKQIAAKENVTLPTSLDAKDQALKDRLSKLSGPAFDKAYMAAMVKDHEHDVTEFRREASSGQDPEVKQFAAKTLPTLQGHLEMAKTTHQKVSH